MYESAGPYEVAFVGPSGSGKTTLIEKLLREMTSQGLDVAVVKHTHHLVDWDQPGKDSWRFREAGAGRVLLSTPERLLVQTRSRQSAPELAGLVDGVDLIVHEGGRQSDADKVLVGESVDQARARGTRGRILAVVDSGRHDLLPWFDRNDVAGVLDFILACAAPAAVARPCPDFETLLERSVASHGHLCPGQVLGVRMTMRGLEELGLTVPPPPKRLIAIVETDRCAADAVASVSGCSLGKRTLKHFDFGKMAASFLDLDTGSAVRVAACDGSRELVSLYAPGVADTHKAQTEAYRHMPDSALLRVQRVAISLSEGDMPGSPRIRVPCVQCGEHVSDDRHVVRGGELLCRSCAGAAYYVAL